MARKRYRKDQRGQVYLFPPSAEEWVPEGHIVFFIRDLMNELDLEPIESLIHDKDPRGERPYDPYVMLGIILLGYCLGIYSSRKLEQATINQVAFRVIAGGSHPHFTTINTFRKTHRTAISALFLGVLLMCKKAGLVNLGHVAVDGTKIKADASRHKAKSYERFTAEEQALMERIQQMLERSERVDQDEDEKFGEGKREFDLPEELARKQTRLGRIRELKAEMEVDAKKAKAAELRRQASEQRRKAEEEEKEAEAKRKLTRARKAEEKAEELDPVDERGDDEPPAPPTTLPRRQMRANTDGTPHPKAQKSPTDPDSHLMKASNGGFEQAYNCQTVVDDHCQIIIAADVTDHPNDANNLMPMLHQATDNCGASPAMATADAGYWNQDVQAQAERLGIKVLVALSRESKKKTATSSPETIAARQRMAEALAKPENKKAYAKRKAIVEPPFGHIKEVRGFRQFSFRGNEAVRAEWRLVALCHNIWKLFRAKTALQPV